MTSAGKSVLRLHDLNSCSVAAAGPLFALSPQASPRNDQREAVRQCWTVS